MSIAELAKCPETLKVYQTMFRTVKESETVDWRQHCFLVQSSSAGPPALGPSALGPRYFSAETRQDLLRVEAAWTHSIVGSVVRLGVSGLPWAFCQTDVLRFRHSACLTFCGSDILRTWHFAISSFCVSDILGFRHSAYLRFCDSDILRTYLTFCDSDILNI